MICFAPRIMLETKLNISDICASFLIDAKQLGSEFQNKVFLVTLAVLVILSIIRRSICGIPLIRQIMQFCSVYVYIFSYQHL